MFVLCCFVAGLGWFDSVFVHLCSGRFGFAMGVGLGLLFGGLLLFDLGCWVGLCCFCLRVGYSVVCLHFLVGIVLVLVC